VAPRIVDLLTFDVTHNPWRCGELFDAIVTDPPYGVRAGAKRLGRKKELAPTSSPRTHTPRPDDQPYIPPTKPYELSALATDLILFARYMLRPSGRLVFFLPTVNEDYAEIDIHAMMCEGMVLISNSLQDFGSWGRRLITIEKVGSDRYPPPAFQPPQSGQVEEEASGERHVPAHKDFREKYFKGFKSSDG